MADETSGKLSRRDWLAYAAMGIGLVLSYGTLAVQAVLFLLPKRLKSKTRPLFAGTISQFKVGEVQTLRDLEGNQILVKRQPAGFQAYSSTCPHLGCKVHWEADKQRFLCPCHNGVFDADGAPVSGPPADAGQHLIEVPLRVDEQSGVIYLEVKA